MRAKGTICSKCESGEAPQLGQCHVAHRVWDYSDPTSPVLASTFNTVCSANPIDPICDPAGTYSSHNVIVETLGNKVLAYIAWYNDGILILDISDPYNPVETARLLQALILPGFRGVGTLESVMLETREVSNRSSLST